MRTADRALSSLRAGRTATAALLSTLLFLPALSSCKKKDPEKCQQGLTTTRQALGAEDFALARQWRDYAYKQCEDTTVLGALDQELVNKEADTNRRAQEQAQKKAELSSVLQLFTRWASENRMAPQNASKLVKCDPVPEGTPKYKEKERWCGATRNVDTRYTFQVRYWDAEPDAVRFSTRPPSPTTCTDLGEAKVLRSWDVPLPNGGTVKRWHCEITGGALAGMQAVTTAAISEVHVFSPKYAQRDPRVTQ
jgi:hypothetical protein